MQLEEPEQGAGPEQSASSFVPKTLLPFMKRLPVKRVVHVANVTEDPVRAIQGIDQQSFAQRAIQGTAQQFFAQMCCVYPEAARCLPLLPAEMLPQCLSCLTKQQMLLWPCTKRAALSWP